MKIIICFVDGLTVSATSRLLNIRRGTITNYFDDCRAEWMNNLAADPIIFDDNGEYEVDECFLRHVREGRRRRYHNIWIGGILERVSGKVLLYQAQDRSHLSLIPPIQDNIPPGSFVYSDEWSVYHCHDFFGIHPLLCQPLNWGIFTHRNFCRGSY